MEKWKYKSLEWIHKVREENYEKTKNLSPAELIEQTRKATDATRLARNKGVAPHILREIEKLVYEHQTFLKEKYHERHRS